MADNKIPLEIEVGLNERSVGVAMEDLKARVKTQGRNIGQLLQEATNFDPPKSGLDAFKKQMAEIKRIGKERVDQEKAEWASMNAAFDSHQKKKQQSVEALSDYEKQKAKERAEREKAAVAEADRIRRITEQRDMEMQRQRWAAEKEQLNFFEGLEKRVRRSALATTELTRAFFGLGLAVTAIGSGAIFGVKFLKDIEDAKMGISGTILSMALLNKQAMTTADAMSITDGVISKLEQGSLKYNVSLADTSKLFQAIVGSGTAAGMTLDEITRISTIGAVAVKSMNLDSKQVVQEIRDLVQGGIQAASSTLATALGLKDKDIKDAKASAEGLFVFLEKRMEGFALMSMERNNTLSGSWDMLWMKVQRLFADPTLFQAVKDSIRQVSDAIATIETDSEGNFKGLKFNEDLVKAAKSYAQTIATLVKLFTELGLALGKVLLVIEQIAPYAIAFYAGGKLATGVASLSAGFGAAASSAGAAAVAVVGVSTALSKLKTFAVGLLTKNPVGIIATMLFGAYELSGYSVIDNLFKNVEDRTKEFQTKIKSLDAEQLQFKKFKVQASIEQIEDESSKNILPRRYDVDGVKLFSGEALDQLKSNLRAIDTQLNTSIKSQEAMYRSAIIAQGSAAEKASRDIAAKTDVSVKATMEIEAAQNRLRDTLMGVGVLLQQEGYAEGSDEYIAAQEKMIEATGRYESELSKVQDELDKSSMSVDKFTDKVAEEKRKVDDLNLAGSIINSTSLREAARTGISILEEYHARELQDTKATGEALYAIKDRQRLELQEVFNDSAKARAITEEFIAKSGINGSDKVLNNFRKNTQTINNLTVDSANTRVRTEQEAANDIIAANDAIYQSKLKASMQTGTLNAAISKLGDSDFFKSTHLTSIQNLLSRGYNTQDAELQNAIVRYQEEYGETVPGFATGGSFTVGGSGGTDSKLVRFMATPGERVTIQTPQQVKTQSITNSDQQVNITINVSGSDDPNRVADMVVAKIQDRLTTKPNLLQSDRQVRRTG